MKSPAILTTLLFIALLSLPAFAQTTAFTYQGKLSDQGVEANGQYQLEFRLFDAASDGNQIGPAITDVNVMVTQGVFTTQLDFGSYVFEAAAGRFIEISVRRNSVESYVTLSPRQPVTSTPYAVKALLAEIAATAENSSQLGGINASEYVQTDNPALTDARDPLPGSANYIQNTTTAQPMSNFNISGEGKAGIFSASSQYNIGTDRILSNGGTFNLILGVGAGGANTGGFNTFIGADAGRDNTAGHQNTFVGRAAGGFNTTGFGGTFLGRSAGLQNTTGEQNTFVGQEAGLSNTTAKYNVFMGALTGRSNTTGSYSTMVGAFAGINNTTGQDHAFFGVDAGRSNTTANGNSFFGAGSGRSTSIGEINSFFGFQSGYTNTTGKWNTFFGGQSGLLNTTGSNNSFFGTFSGLSNTTGNANSFFGLDAGRHNTEGNNNAFFGFVAGRQNLTGVNNAFFGTAAGRMNTTGSFNSFFGPEAGLNTNANANAFFGSAAGITNTSGEANAFFGADAGRLNQTGRDNAFIGTFAGYNSVSGDFNTFVGVGSGQANTTGSNNTLVGTGANVGVGNLTFATAIGSGATVSTNDTIVLGRGGGQDKVRIPGLGSAGFDHLCRNANNEISSCSSSLRYKTNISSFNLGLDVVNRLRPITFDWKDGGVPDLGLGAEEVAAVNELLVVRNSQGQVEGVKYDRIGVVLINVVKEQQSQIDELKKQIAVLRQLLTNQEETQRTTDSEGGQK